MVYDPPTTESFGISVAELLADPGLGLVIDVVAGREGTARRILHPRIQKSGLALVGHLHGLVPTRVQVLGETELSFVEALGADEQKRAASHLFSLSLACVLVSRGAAVPVAFHEAAEVTGTPLLVCQERSSLAITAIHTLLDARLAPRSRIHGVLVDVFEVGVLLLGESGIGKSECALELVMRGHRLVADDVVECDYRPPGMVFAEPADLLRHHIEVRGLGVLDIQDLYGVTAVRDRKRVDLVIRLEAFDSAKIRDRIGARDETFDILGVPIRCATLPVRSGRNTSAIVEIAARNELLRQTGRDSHQAFIDKVDARLGASERPEEGEQGPAAFGSRPPVESSVPPPVGEVRRGTEKA